MGRDAEARLSKSKFMCGLQCLKWLWWEVHEPDAEELEVDPATQFVFDRGTEVGELARTYVPGGVLIDVPHRERERRLRETAEAVRNGARVLYEPAFEHDGVLILADILRRGRGGWTLIEVKSSTRRKPEHLFDLAIQAHVLRGAGVELERMELMHLSRECRFPALSDLFTREDCTDEVEGLLPRIPVEVRTQKKALRGPLPTIGPGDHCTDPYECPFLSRCWPEPPRHDIGTLYRLGTAMREDYREQGFRTLLDLPSADGLSPIQQRQIRAARADSLIVEKGLGPALERLQGPFAYLDFETVAPPIPVWDGCRPYDPVPAQMSVHRVGRGGRLLHREWLAEGPGDPRETAARKLLEFTRGARCILAYNAAFERRCVKDLGEHLPRLAGRLAEVEGRITDLLPIVRDHVYHPDFGGSFSLKSVAPALVPGLSYEELEVSDGGEAGQILFRLLLRSEEVKKREKARLRRDLLRYCRMDTLALFKLHRRLEELSAL